MKPDKNAYFVAAAIAIATFVLPTSASAATITLPSAGTMVIGMVSGDGRPWAGFLPTGGGACSWWLLGDASGLSSGFYVKGSSGMDTIYALNHNTNFCGFTFTPVVLNGFWLDTNSMDGNDIVSGKFRTIIGYNGNDLLQGVEGFTGRISGNLGDDLLYGGADVLKGEDGNDVLCVLSGTTSITADGGFGNNDRACGTFTSFWYVEYANTSSHCPSSCFPFGN
jgi:hypothetical protein